MDIDPAQRVKDFSTALDAFTDTIPEASRAAASFRICTEWRHIRMSGITALLHGDFQLASRMYAACHAATRISVIIDETTPDHNPDAAGAAQQAQAAAGRLIREFEIVADHLQMAVTKPPAAENPEPPECDCNSDPRARCQISRHSGASRNQVGTGTSLSL